MLEISDKIPFGFGHWMVVYIPERPTFSKILKRNSNSFLLWMLNTLSEKRHIFNEIILLGSVHLM